MTGPDPRTDPTIGMSPDSTLTRLAAGAPAASLPVLEDLIKTLGARYNGLRRLGRGGMGEVFLARDPALKRNIAIKVLAAEYASDESARARFVREAQAAAAVAHPNVVSIYHVGELNETRAPYFAMQFIEGKTLDDEYPAGSTAPEGAARRIIAEVAAALASAHARGLVHRDIKPSNIMLDPQTGRAIVLDFGISASVSDLARADDRLTAAGAYIGTPRYMSPEQAAGHDATEKSDVYSLGCVAFELLTGRPVFTADTVLELFASHLRDAAPAASSLRPSIDPELNALVGRCLEKDPARRPTAIEIVRRLSPEGGALLEWPPPGLEPFRGASSRLASFFALGSAVTFVALAALLQLGGLLQTARSSLGALSVLSAIVGVVLLFEGCRRAIVVGRAASKLVHSGYGWLTVLEVASDPDGETGDLISGSRRFGGLRAELRSMLRSRRMVRAAALLVAALSPVPALIAFLSLASAGYVGRGIVWAPPLVTLALLFFARRLRRNERKLAPVRARGAQRAEPATDTTVAPLWYDSFESARAGQHLGRGPARRSNAAVAGGVLIAMLIALTACTLVPIILVSATGGALWRLAIPNFESAIRKTAASDGWREFTVAPNPAILPLAAGRAFFALQPLTASDPDFPETQVHHLAAPWDSGGIPAGLFPSAQPDSATFIKAPAPRAILAAAVHGFSREEMAYLERFAHDPFWRTVDTVARARAIDFAGGRFVVPFRGTAEWFYMPGLNIRRTKAVGYAASSRAAYYLALGQRDSAEAAIRTAISFGFAMADNATNLLEQLTGVAIVGIGRDALIQYYTVTNNPRAPQLSARRDSIAVRFATADSVPDLGGGLAVPADRDVALDPQRARVTLRAVVLDGTQSRGTRMDLLRSLAFAPCTNPGEMVFGAAEDVESAFAYARLKLARYPSDSALIEMIHGMTARMEDEHASALVPRAIIGAASIASTVFHNRRMRGCTQLIVGGAASF